MTNEADVDAKEYVVVTNDEEQYSIWRSDRPIPKGWKDEGTRGPKAACLEHIDTVWTDMRPLSVRRALAEPPKSVEQPPPPARPADGKNDLVGRLEVAQPILFVGRPESSAAELHAQIERGRVFVRFQNTGTELGIKLDAKTHAAARAAITAASGTVAVEGDLILNYNSVRFLGELEFETLRGSGRLMFLGATKGS